MDDYEVALRQLSGKVTAIELVVKMLIITHPDRAALAHAWHSILPEAIDHITEQPAANVPEQMDALNTMLGDLSGFIEMELPSDDTE